MNDSPPERDPLADLEHALRTLPLASPPPALARRIMTRVRAESQPRFHLRWADYVLSACTAGAAGAFLMLLPSLTSPFAASTGWQSTVLVNHLLFDLLNTFTIPH